MKIRTKTKERLLSEGWVKTPWSLQNYAVSSCSITSFMMKSLGKVIDVIKDEDYYRDEAGYLWAPSMIETKEEQVLRILKEYESRRQGGN